MRYTIDDEDFRRAVVVLENELPDAATWTLSRIKNNLHGLAPFGDGIVITLEVQLYSATALMQPVERVVEKAGNGKTLEGSASAAVRRLKEQIRNREQQGYRLPKRES